ncbi:MAG: primosomal protein N' [Flavobacteriales bacterium]|nr:primosomal protein N' [Flavobacteriia bacterium]NCP07057.1 primosomal protein N' [Flavobacteriales bacterium]PIV93567.1 MAG: primosomal protein N' [Flavobacteriaceae bacterium CG17_big_fil_post_rev_8_21_14_2_50_33_15]PIY10163.1 MAG: primosomal protein N' [Flavobacteriaceae bacterium CG_4_10_14_3_um_filter_33_47]PJB19437.1 MAG: primosomal protein N' [Flavobacteriaceae bacterium CG_4_9_14_3_um_filter_33_16]
MSHFIDVILPIPLEKLFTYSINSSEADFIKVGMRVAVPFGKSKIYTGLVYKIHQDEPLVYEAKDIHQILDDSPMVNPYQLKLWEWIAGYYMCTLGDVFRAALPNAFILESETVILLNTDKIINDDVLNDDEFLVYEALHHQSSLKIHDISNILDRKTVLPVIKRLIEKEAIKVEEEVYEKYKPKLVRYVKLHPQFSSDEALQNLLTELSRAPKQSQVILTLFSISAKTKKPVKVSDLSNESGASPTIIKSLIDKGILEEFHLQVDRVQYSGEDTKTSKELNEFQITALQDIKTAFKDKSVVLLHGVTSSGKTEIYVKLIEEAIANGKQVLYLLPEIALTTQLVTRLQHYFGEQVAVFHSKYSSQERVEVWNYVLNNSDKARIVLGARSSIFLPFSNLGLIIVDEEHEQSFKQFDPAPRYHVRDTAIVLASLHQTKTLLGSATPSLESYYNTKQNKYGLVEINTRYNNVLMPHIELVDIKEKQKRKLMKGHFSDRLIEEMTNALQEGNQIILFQNRRGFSPIVECNTCGISPQCPNCDVSLTYHHYRDQLRCHYCGYHMVMIKNCSACGSIELDSKGFGTEQIEEEVKLLFQNAKVARMDLDTTRGKYGYEKIISAFEQQDIDVLVGTQMLTKGLDFRNVKLVGIMNADTMLNFPDFRAHERSFQLMLQVSGRAGRTDQRGKVLIQTYNPYHKILQQVSTNDYLGMYDEQMDERHNYKYPPIYKQIKITLKHKDYNRVDMGSQWLAKSLRQVFAEAILGPESPPIARIRNQFHKNILVKIPKKQSLSKTKEAIIKINNSFWSIKEFRSVKVILNVDNF